MKIKIFPLFLAIIFLIIFVIFYKGLNNSNIYTPETNLKKDVPNFKTKIFNSEKLIESDEIFENDNSPTLSFLECKLETGRTHQIRVHMNYKGNSIVGDDKYKKKFKRIKDIDPELEKNLIKINRQFLHAKTLGFIHPKKNKEMIFNSNLPRELEKIIKILGNT